MNITPQQALANLYNAARQAKLSADEHSIVLDSAKVIGSIINPKKEEVTPEVKPTE